jgi:hypothetical protein
MKWAYLEYHHLFAHKPPVPCLTKYSDFSRQAVAPAAKSRAPRFISTTQPRPAEARRGVVEGIASTLRLLTRD